MPEFITLQDAAHRYAISESTLHKWLNKHWLAANRVLVRGHAQYLIDTEELEKRLSERGMLGRTSTANDEISLTSRVEALEQRVHALEARLQALEHPTPDYALPTFSSIPDPHSAPETLTPGYVLFHTFFHGIHRSTAMRWIKASPYQEQIGTGHAAQFILSPQGQHAYFLWAKDREGFELCPICPHDSI